MDDDDDIFGMAASAASAMDTEEPCLAPVIHLADLEDMLLDCDVAGLRGVVGSLCDVAPTDRESAWKHLSWQVAADVLAIAEGRYGDVLLGDAGQALVGVEPAGSIDTTHASVVDVMTRRLQAYVVEANEIDGTVTTTETDPVVLRAARAMLAGIAALQLYMQINWTGPDLDDTAQRAVSSVQLLQAKAAVAPAAKSTVEHGAVESKHVEASAGDISVTPAAAEQEEEQDEEEEADAVLSTNLSHLGLDVVVSPLQQAVLKCLAVDGEDVYVLTKDPVLLLVCTAIFKALLAVRRLGSASALGTASKSLRTLGWWAARSVSIWQRSTTGLTPVASLLSQVVSALRPVADAVVPEWSSLVLTDQSSLPETVAPNPDVSTAGRSARQSRLGTRLLMEWGITQHMFALAAGAKLAFRAAQLCSGLQAEMSGVLGRLTKYQEFDSAVLALLAKSNESGAGASEPADTHTSISTAVSLESVDAETHLLETMHITDTDQDKITAILSVLSQVDQTIVLGLCLDVKNHNPHDGLTSEQMRPYVEKIVQRPSNWLIYSTALLIKSALEFERTHTRDRSIFQLQALVDQATNQLTVTQFSTELIKDSSPVQDRLKHVYSLAYPSRWDLQRQLADRYKAYGAFRSALELYKKLQLWNDIIDCYLVLEKPKACAKIIRARMALQETPQLWYMLGLATNDETCMERAWQVSNQTFAQAKRVMARRHFGRKEYRKCIEDAEAALRINSLFPATWTQLGCSAMCLGDWELAISAFARVVQQDPEDGQAWANLGSVHVRLGNAKPGFSALEQAARFQSSNWKVWANFVVAALDLRKLTRAIYGFHQILKCCDEARTDVDVRLLIHLVSIVTGSLLYARAHPLLENNVEHAGSDTHAAELTPAASASLFPAAPGDIHMSDDDIEGEPVSSQIASQDATAAASAPLETETPSDVTMIAPAPAAPSAAAGDSQDEFDSYGRPAAVHAEPLLGLMNAVTSKISNNPVIWHAFARFQAARGNLEEAADCLLKQCRSLHTGKWAENTTAITKMVNATSDYVRMVLPMGSLDKLMKARLQLRTVIDEASVKHSDHPGLPQMQELLQQVIEQDALLRAAGAAGAAGGSVSGGAQAPES